MVKFGLILGTRYDSSSNADNNLTAEFIIHQFEKNVISKGHGSF